MKQRLPLLALSVASLLALGCKGGGDASTRPATPAPAPAPAPSPVQPEPDETPAAPSITDVSPESGRPGDVVLIKGTHFAGPLRVEIGGVSAALVATGDRKITVTVPEQAKTGQVVVYAKGGRVVSSAVFQVSLKPFDPLVDVAPFNIDQVEHWPGLTNAGASCFLNTAIKLLATIREVDPTLVDHPGDDAVMAGVRRQLRFTLNHIRLGDKRPADAPDPMRALIDAFRHHPKLAEFATASQGTGGYEIDTLKGILKVLGLDHSFDIKLRVRYLKNGTPLNYKDHRFDLTLSPSKKAVGFDFQGPKTLDAFVSHITRNPGGTDQELSWFNYPVQVPNTSIISITHMTPRLDLAFTSYLHIPIYKVDETLHNARIVKQALLHPVAASMWKGGHVYAVILGRGGFYVNDDAKKPQLEDRFLKDGILAETQNLVNEMGVIIYRRDS